MSHAKMPPVAHKLYAIGLIVIVVFVLIAWVFTAISLSAKTITNLPDHSSSMSPQTCSSCHQTNSSAPRIPHIEMPTCGYCHR